MYYIEKEYNGELDHVSDNFIAHLRKGGYVIVADIDVKSILKRALNFDFKNYHIFEICKPQAAKEIIGNDDMNGLFLPCKLIIFQDGALTKVRLLKSSDVASHFFDKSAEMIRNYETELIRIIEGFSF